MERLVTVKDVKEQFRCSGQTARKYLRQVSPHYENPLAAPEWAYREWEEGRLVFPQQVSRKRREELTKRATQRVIVPRTRD